MSWHVLYSRPKAEVLAAKRLQELGIAACAPTHRVLREWSDRRKWVNMALFPSYVFAEIGPEHWRKIEKVTQLINFVYIGKEPARLTPKDLEFIQNLSLCKEEIQLGRDGLLAGQTVEILNGPLIGYQGMVSNPDRNGRVYIEIVGLQTFVSINGKNFEYKIV